MSALFFIFWSSLVIGFSGAIMPGSVLTTTIAETMKRGFRAGPLIVLGHSLLELLVLVAVITGLGAWIVRDPVLGVLCLGGGLLLIAMGVQMALTAKAATHAALHATADPRGAIRGPVLAGFLVSLSNPYWVVWWATIGLNYAALSLRHGAPGLASFYTGHILADLIWYSLVAAGVAGGRRICPPWLYRALIVLCGIVLIALGAHFIRDGALRLAR